MDKGIIYVMTTAVDGLIKIGKTGTDNFLKRMYNLEHNGYYNVAGLKRCYAIEVDEYDNKETLIHSIFEKSRVGTSELFAVDVNIVIQLLASFEGKTVYPEDEDKEQIFIAATDNVESKLIPDGTYYFLRKKKSDNKEIKATAIIKDGMWTLIKGSILGVNEDLGMSDIATAKRKELKMDSSGILLKDALLGKCTPSFAGSVVANQAIDGWKYWKNSAGEAIDIYRHQDAEEDE